MTTAHAFTQDVWTLRRAITISLLVATNPSCVSILDAKTYQLVIMIPSQNVTTECAFTMDALIQQPATTT